MPTVVPVISRLKLGRILRTLREQAGLTLEQVEADMDLSRSGLSRVEKGQQSIHPMIVRAMLESYQAPMEDWEEILELARESRKKSDWQVFGASVNAYVSMEAEATCVRNFEPMMVPGLLQTKEYAEQVFSLDKPQSQMRNLAIRLKRRERLTGFEPLDFHAIVDEAVFQRRVGGPVVMREQAEFLIESMKLPSVTLQVIPDSVALHHGLRGAYSVLSFPPDTIPDVGYVDHAGGSLQLTNTAEVNRLIHRFQELAGLALSPDESVKLISRYTGRLTA